MFKSMAEELAEQFNTDGPRSIRKLVLEVLVTEMGFDVTWASETVVGNGSEKGYEIILQRRRFEDGLDTTRFTAWSERELEVIERYRKLFDAWFALSEPVVEHQDAMNVEEFADFCAGTYGKGKIDVLNPLTILHRHHPEGDYVDVSVMLRIYG